MTAISTSASKNDHHTTREFVLSLTARHNDPSDKNEQDIIMSLHTLTDAMVALTHFHVVLFALHCCNGIAQFVHSRSQLRMFLVYSFI